jgi:hypothetical protein
MVMRSTRLEFLIVTTAFVILLLCSRPPRPGSARTVEPEALDTRIPTVNPAPAVQTPMVAEESTHKMPAVQTPAAPVATIQPETPQTPKPAAKRMASVDARKCPGLNYRQIMYGEVTVRWVWDGTKLVPRKVCVVNEPGGTTSVWSFDDPGDAILTEIGDLPADGR